MRARIRKPLQGISAEWVETGMKKAAWKKCLRKTPSHACKEGIQIPKGDCLRNASGIMCVSWDSSRVDIGSNESTNQRTRHWNLPRLSAADSNVRSFFYVAMAMIIAMCGFRVNVFFSEVCERMTVKPFPLVCMVHILQQQKTEDRKDPP